MRKICVVTGTRAEYGLLYWLMKEIQSDPALELQLIVTGMHLSPEFGLTYQQIEQDGFKIHAKVEMLLSSDTSIGVTKSLGLGIIGFADALAILSPDILVVLGDRYEIFAAAQAALLAKIPLAHIHGGEVTEGAIDEAMRHSITKIAQIHFTSTEIYKKRVLQLGEQPEKVFNFGAIGLDNILKTKFLTKSELEKSLNFQLGNKTFLVTYHPVTLSSECMAKPFKELLKALEQFPDYKIIFTKPNADPGGRIISTLIDKYVRANTQRAIAFTSLGHLRYLSLIQYVSVVIGNSSSGITEVPYFNKPTINLGLRQKGRINPDSVIDCSEETSEIIKSIKKALSRKFLLSLQKSVNPYGQGNTSVNIKNVLKSVSLDNIILKKFIDL